MAQAKVDEFKAAGRKTRDQKRLEAEARQAGSRRRNELKREIEILEKEIGELETRQKEIEEKLARAETYRDSEIVIFLKNEYARVKEELPARYWRWEEAHQEFEKVMSEISAASEKDG